MTSSGSSSLDASATQSTGALNSQQILTKVNQRYRMANSYRDQGVLDLSYRLNGQTINEPKRFTTQFSRAQNRLLVEIYNSRVVANGRVLLCEVFDDETANLENQKLLLPYQDQIPLEALLRDSIANHFLAGFSDLPLNEAHEKSGPKLIPAPLSLLTGQAVNPWLQSPIQSERLADQTLGKIECYVIRAMADGMTADIWIEKDRWLVVKMSLPLKLLAREVVASAQVTDVVLTARYQQAQLDAGLDWSDEQVDADAVWVRKFVQLPEPLPSELIGKPAPAFQILRPDGARVASKSLHGKHVVLFWVEGSAAIEQLKPFATAIKRLQQRSATDPNSLVIALLYSEAELKRRNTESLEPYSRVKKLGQQLNVPIYFDPNRAAAAALKVKSVPGVVVLNQQHQMQYANGLSDSDWVSDVETAIARVIRGDDLALEMKNEYASYLDEYYQQLTTVDARELARSLGSDLRIRQASSSKPNGPSGTLQINPRKLWHCPEFKQPGNIAAIGPAAVSEIRSDTDPTGKRNRYSIFDGWQTMGLVDSAGKLIQRQTLGLANTEAATIVRGTAGGTANSERFLVFSPYGDRVLLFGTAFAQQSKRVINVTQPIRDARFCDLDQNGASELLVAHDGGGIELIDPLSGERQMLTQDKCDALVGFGRELVILRNGQLTAVRGQRKLQDQLAENAGWSVARLMVCGNRQLLATGKNRAGQWSAIAFDSDFKQQWSLQVGPQLFESSLQPIATVQWGEDLVWAIADSNDLIQLVTGSGKWIGEFQSPSALAGLSLSLEQDEKTGKSDIALTIANQAGVESWALQVTKQ